MEDKQHVNFDDFVEFLSTLNDGKHTCPFCKGLRWTLSASVDVHVDGKQVKVTSFLPLGTTGEGKSALVTGGMNIISMSCNDCGYINLFDYHVVAKKLEKIRSQLNEEKNREER
ncbi:hypothetical protein [Serratia liquefaciens]|uniref:hypothetical protein n=1 Tax=Serratia liquefaciens TaxID=614 RepID=UPI00115E981B|nr:hypothetical protein [Serratia liquefaciens]